MFDERRVETTLADAMRLALGRGRRRSVGQERTKVLTVEVSPDEKMRIGALAAKAGMPVAKYMRARALGAPTSRAELKVAVAGLAAAAGRVGNNLNQLAKRVNEGRVDAGIGPEVMAIRDELRQAIAELRNAMRIERGSSPKCDGAGRSGEGQCK
ncbi:MAG: plasmid mobilization relaxosome protein MobC [Alphaproteobacteria bacterium]|nr:plasmid mobilization relaxosome protein MobC [Alphaproteobacteria bacterium]